MPNFFEVRPDTPEVRPDTSAVRPDTSAVRPNTSAVRPDAFEECKRVIAEHSKSFDLASRLLPAERRNEVAALYAWCRHCDDAIDLAPPHEHAAAMSTLHEELESIYSGKPQDRLVHHCFQQVALSRKIPRAYPAGLLEGMAMDVECRPYETTEQLLEYCWCVAGTVGLMMCHVIGLTDQKGLPHAAHLGIGMQLSNIARDIAEDWERGRIYVPAELRSPSLRQALTQHGAERPLADLSDQSRADLAKSTEQLLGLADLYYASADRGMNYLDPRSAFAIRTARFVYAEIGHTVRRRNCDIRRGRAIVPKRRKAILTLAALRHLPRDRKQFRAQQMEVPQRILHWTEAVRLA